MAKDLEIEKMQKVILQANKLREMGKSIMLVPRNNNARYQKERLAEFGVENFIEIFNDTQINLLDMVDKF